MITKPMVHVIDDDESLRTALLRLLNGSGFEATGYRSTGDFLLRHPPDRHGCVLLDIRMPGGPSGLELNAVLKEQGIHLPVVFMTGHADVASSVAAMKGGAVDYLEKPIAPQALLDAIGRALARDAAARGARQERAELKTAFASLSQRERQVFDLIVEGKLNKQIAAALGVAERTVKAQRASVLAKLGVSSVAELGRLAERLRSLGDGRQ
ncbi:MAG: response regulator [Aestuariivirgaceae bacterium]